jgi:hypothetical protein
VKTEGKKGGLCPKGNENGAKMVGIQLTYFVILLTFF